MKSGNQAEVTLADSALFTLLHELLETQRLAALATQQEGQAYLSLMVFASTPDLKQLIVATHRHTRKYANFMAEPRVALLIDNRSNVPSDTEEAIAVTGSGWQGRQNAARKRGQGSELTRRGTPRILP